MNRTRRLLYGVALLAPLAAGCISYAYPKLDYVPGSDFGPQITDVHAFRFDLTVDRIDRIDRDNKRTGLFGLTEIKLRADGSIPAQVNLSVERGEYVVGAGPNYTAGSLHTTLVRLYRPGYLLVELPAGGSVNGVRWEPAPDWSAQEAAIDDLISRPTLIRGTFVKSREPFFRYDETGLPREIGSLSSAFPRPYLYAAGEYARVAQLAPTEPDAARLRKKAQVLLEPTPIAGSCALWTTEPDAAKLQKKAQLMLESKP
jgi:hypothetical protein